MQSIINPKITYKIDPNPWEQGRDNDLNVNRECNNDQLDFLSMTYSPKIALPAWHPISDDTTYRLINFKIVKRYSLSITTVSFEERLMIRVWIDNTP